MYCFQLSLPDSRPPPVCFSPPEVRTSGTQYGHNQTEGALPKAPPISAPLVGIFTLTIPQSDPFGLKYHGCTSRSAPPGILYSPNPLEHIRHILTEQAAGKALLDFVIPLDSFVQALQEAMNPYSLTSDRQQAHLRLQDVQYRSESFLEHHFGVMFQAFDYGWLYVIAWPIDHLERQ